MRGDMNEAIARSTMIWFSRVMSAVVCSSCAVASASSRVAAATAWRAASTRAAWASTWSLSTLAASSSLPSETRSTLSSAASWARLARAASRAARGSLDLAAPTGTAIAARSATTRRAKNVRFRVIGGRGP